MNGVNEVKGVHVYGALKIGLVLSMHCFGCALTLNNKTVLNFKPFSYGLF